MRAVGRSRVWVSAAVVVGALLAVGAASASADPPKVVIEFDGSGTFSATNGAGTDHPSHADVSLKWTTTYAGTLESDGSISGLQATGAAASGEVTQTTAPPPGMFHFTSTGLDTADCSGPLVSAPGAPAPVATDSDNVLTVQSITAVDQNNNANQVSCQGTGPIGDSVDLSADAANLAGTFGQSLPDVLAARITLPPDAIKSGTFTQNVSDGDAPQQLPGSCADQFGLPEGQCPMSLHWSGTIKISVPCGIVSSSEGDAPAVGTLINPGQTIATGTGSRLEITLPDGAIYRLGPNSKMTCKSQETTSQKPPTTIEDQFHLLLGHVWGAIEEVTGAPRHEFDDAGGAPDASPGVRGSAFTESVQPNGQVLFHVIQGTGFIRVTGRPEFDFPAGEGVMLTPKSRAYTETTGWPATDRALVPALQMPPALAGVRVTGGRAHRRAVVHFKLGARATVTVQVTRGRHRVVNHKAGERSGAGSIKLSKLPQGRYTLTIFATAGGRSTATQKSFRVT